MGAGRGWWTVTYGHGTPAQRPCTRMCSCGGSCWSLTPSCSDACRRPSGAPTGPTVRRLSLAPDPIQALTCVCVSLCVLGAQARGHGWSVAAASSRWRAPSVSGASARPPPVPCAAWACVGPSPSVCSVAMAATWPTGIGGLPATPHAPAPQAAAVRAAPPPHRPLQPYKLFRPHVLVLPSAHNRKTAQKKRKARGSHTPKPARVPLGALSSAARLFLLLTLSLSLSLRAVYPPPPTPPTYGSLID
jgi:hypothetical protein